MRAPEKRSLFNKFVKSFLEDVKKADKQSYINWREKRRSWNWNKQPLEETAYTPAAGTERHGGSPEAPGYSESDVNVSSNPGGLSTKVSPETGALISTLPFNMDKVREMFKKFESSDLDALMRADVINQQWTAWHDLAAHGGSASYYELSDLERFHELLFPNHSKLSKESLEVRIAYTMTMARVNRVYDSPPVSALDIALRQLIKAPYDSAIFHRQSDIVKSLLSSHRQQFDLLVEKHGRTSRLARYFGCFLLQTCKWSGGLVTRFIKETCKPLVKKILSTVIFEPFSERRIESLQGQNFQNVSEIFARLLQENLPDSFLDQLPLPWGHLGNIFIQSIVKISFFFRIRVLNRL